MTFALACVAIGLLLLLMALLGSLLKRLPLTAALIYLLAGVGLGPYGLKLIRVDPLQHSALLERLTEVAVILSLFSAGLKLRSPLHSPRWGPPVRLATLSMVVTVGLVALAGVQMGLPLGAAVLLGAVLAPTDPVLASDVQVEHAEDRDRLRFSLTGEAGLNDGTAFPFVMLGLGLLGLHNLGENGWRWIAIDLLWAAAGGVGIGSLLGWLVATLALRLRRAYREVVGLDDFLALGLIALSYGLALLAHTYGFLAVFAAGLALRRVERQSSGETIPDEVLHASTVAGESDLATDPEKAPAHMAQAVLVFNEHLERIGEVGLVVLLGAMLSFHHLPQEAMWFVPLLFLVIRPISVAIGLAGSRVSSHQRRLMGWFGVRGIGSLYYLMYALQHGLAGEAAERLVWVTFTVVLTSIVVHGISVTPLMEHYSKRRRVREATVTGG